MNHYISENEILEQLIKAMESSGIYPKDTGSLKFNGKICRFATTDDDNKEKTGWCKIFIDGLPSGAFGDWRKDIKSNWKYDITGHSDEVQKHYLNPENRQLIDIRQKEAEIELKELHRNAAIEAEKIFINAKAALLKHPYIQKKDIQVFGLKQHGKYLLVPFTNIVTGEFSTYQYIAPTGAKFYYKNATKENAVYTLGVNITKGIVLICEGAATAHTLHELTGLTVICCGDCGNLKACVQNIKEKYKGRRIIVCADNDHLKKNNTGIKTAQAACSESGFNGYIYPEFSQDNNETDWNDYAALHGKEATKEEIKRQIKKVLSKKDECENTSENESCNKQKKAVATILFEICNENNVFAFRRKDISEIYCRFPIGNKYHVDSIESSAFDAWLTGKYYDIFKCGYNENDIRGTYRLLRMKAFKNPSQEVFYRWGWKDDIIYCDLCNKSGEVIEISSKGWKLIKKPNVMFIRSPSMLPLPEPIKNNASWQAMRPFINTTDEDFNIIVAWLLSICTNVEHYILALSSGQDTGKSTLSQIITSIIDPRNDSLISPPKDSGDLYALATERYIVSLENVSKITSELSDDLCRLTNGGAYIKRELRSDNKAYKNNIRRVILLNGINISPERPDLLSRTLVIEPLSINTKIRRTKEDILKGFENIKPFVLAALFDSISGALKENSYKPSTIITRQTDSEIFIRRACHSGSMPFTENEFINLLTAAEQNKTEEALNNSLFASKILELKRKMPLSSYWEGTALELIDLIRNNPAEYKYLPRTSKMLSVVIAREAPLLQVDGIRIIKTRTNVQRRIKIIFNSEPDSEIINPLAIFDEGK